MQNNLPQSNPIDPIVGSQLPVSGPDPASNPVMAPDPVPNLTPSLDPVAISNPVSSQDPVQNSTPDPVVVPVLAPDPVTVYQPAEPTLPEEPSSAPAPIDMTPEAIATPIETPTELSPTPVEATEPMASEVQLPTEPIEQPISAPINIDIPAVPPVREEVTPSSALPVEEPQQDTQSQMHANAASLNVISDIIPEPAPKTDELSQVFQMTPSDVNIPAGPAPVSTGDEPVMISTDQFMAQVQGADTSAAVASPDQMQSSVPAPEKIGQVNVSTVPQTPGKSFSLIKILIWIIILILGVIAVALGLYFANILQIPFLNSIFGR